MDNTSQAISKIRDSRDNLKKVVGLLAQEDSNLRRAINHLTTANDADAAPAPIKPEFDEARAEARLGLQCQNCEPFCNHIIQLMGHLMIDMATLHKAPSEPIKVQRAARILRNLEDLSSLLTVRLNG